MAISCVILDDEPTSVRHLEGYVRKVPSLSLSASFIDPYEAMSYIHENKVDLVFVDVKMPNFDIDGLHVVTALGKEYRYIFTTGYRDFAEDAFDYDAIDFLSKPITFARFSEAVQKATKLIKSPSELDTPDTYLYVRVGGKYQQIDYDAICWIESNRSYVKFFTDEHSFDVNLPISEFEKQLPTTLFIRVHKSYIVAKARMKFVEANKVSILRNDQLKSIPVSDTYRKELIEAITQRSVKRRYTY